VILGLYHLLQRLICLFLPLGYLSYLLVLLKCYLLRLLSLFFFVFDFLGSPSDLLPDHIDFRIEELFALLSSQYSMLFYLKQAHIETYEGGVVHLCMALVTYTMLSFIRLAELHLVEGAFLADCAATAGAVILSG